MQMKVVLRQGEFPELPEVQARASLTTLERVRERRVQRVFLPERGEASDAPSAASFLSGIPE